MQWEIYVLYESMSERMQSPKGLSEAVASTIGVKQGSHFHPLSSVSNLMRCHITQRFGGSKACVLGIVLQIILYADDIGLTSDSLDGLQRHLSALKVFCTDKGLSIDIDKTKVMVLNTIE